MNDFQARLNKAAARARDFEKEARKALETLGDRAQAELKTLLQNAQTSSREQVSVLGAELEKLGKRLQQMAASAKPPPAAHAADAAGTDDKATQPPPGTVQ
jgi:DNA anti-recombination protein RmuC